MIASGINEQEKLEAIGVGLIKIKSFEPKNQIKTYPIKYLK